MARSSQLDGKFSVIQVIMLILIVLMVLFFWSKRMEFFEEDPLISLGLKHKTEPTKEPAVDEKVEDEKLEKDLPPIKVTVKSDSKAREEAREFGDVSKANTYWDAGSGSSAKTATLIRPVEFVYKKSGGAEKSFTAPKGSIVMILKNDGNRLRVRLMGREGWVPVDATDLGK